MKLWLISQEQNSDYDTYDSLVVAAETEDDARKTPPTGYLFEGVDWHDRAAKVWASGPEHVVVKHIGTAAEGTAPGVILASFNSG